VTSRLIALLLYIASYIWIQLCVQSDVFAIVHWLMWSLHEKVRAEARLRVVGNSKMESSRVCWRCRRRTCVLSPAVGGLRCGWRRVEWCSVQSFREQQFLGLRPETLKTRAVTCIARRTGDVCSTARPPNSTAVSEDASCNSDFATFPPES
jgi:hypothetical protein